MYPILWLKGTARAGHVGVLQGLIGVLSFQPELTVKISIKEAERMEAGRRCDLCALAALVSLEMPCSAGSAAAVLHAGVLAPILHWIRSVQCQVDKAEDEGGGLMRKRRGEWLGEVWIHHGTDRVRWKTVPMQ